MAHPEVGTSRKGVSIMNFLPKYLKKITRQAGRHSLLATSRRTSTAKCVSEALRQPTNFQQFPHKSVRPPSQSKDLFAVNCKKRLVFKPFVYEYYFGQISSKYLTSSTHSPGPGQEVPEFLQTRSFMLNIFFSPGENTKIQVGGGRVEGVGGWGG